MYIRYYIYAIILVSTFIASVHGAVMNQSFGATDVVTINQTYTLSNSPATPFIIWAAAGYLGILLLILSFFSFPNGEEGLISILAWIPLAFTAFTSFSVDIVNGSGVVGGSGIYTLIENHTVYSFNTIAILFFVTLAFAVGNTYRIWTTQKSLLGASSDDQKEEII
jgi:hypothetical protein